MSHDSKTPQDPKKGKGKTKPPTDDRGIGDRGIGDRGIGDRGIGDRGIGDR